MVDFHKSSQFMTIESTWSRPTEQVMWPNLKVTDVLWLSCVWRRTLSDWEWVTTLRRPLDIKPSLWIFPNVSRMSPLITDRVLQAWFYYTLMLWHSLPSAKSRISFQSGTLNTGISAPWTFNMNLWLSKIYYNNLFQCTDGFREEHWHTVWKSSSGSQTEAARRFAHVTLNLWKCLSLVTTMLRNTIKKKNSEGNKHLEPNNSRLCLRFCCWCYTTDEDEETKRLKAINSGWPSRLPVWRVFWKGQRGNKVPLNHGRDCGQTELKEKWE